MRTVLVIGQNGQVSTYLQQALQGDYQLVVAGRDQLDLLQVGKIRSVLGRLKPSVIINPAAYTAVDLAEQETQQADAINHLAVAEIAEYCAETTTPLIHFSTDYVFNGNATQAYVETDQAKPNGVYGKTKFDGEQAVLNSGAPAIILRTSWVYSNQGKNFYKTMLALAESRNELSVVADQIGSPTYAQSIAVATGKLLQIILQQGEIKSEQVGVYHFSCGGETSWCEFAKAIFAKHQIGSMVVSPITTDQYPTPAKRPAYSVLDNTKLMDTFGVSLPSWEAALDACILESNKASASQPSKNNS
ncbi:UNVERIFIED_CONTAM: hypothetical protein GTU68_048922 [Idotea baltica]|nr:hypothetical protein [Idotea baltica]